MEINKEPSLESIEDRPTIGLPLAPEMNPVDYLPDMEGFDLTKAEKIALLETLWNTMRTIVEIGVAVGEVDLCGQVFGSLPELPDSWRGGVRLSFSKATEKPSDSSDNGETE